MAKIKKIELSQEELQKLWEYTPDTGVFRWNTKVGTRGIVGSVAGSFSKSTGYCVIQYNKQIYKAHRLAWVYVYGEIPDGLFVDHKNMDKSNNRIDNLRLCTKAENHNNVGLRRDNVSGVKGVTWSNSHGKWCVHASVNCKRVHIGYFVNKQDAVEAHKLFCKQHHGEFYRDATKEIL